MRRKHRSLLYAIVGLVVLAAATSGHAQAHRMAVFVQSAATVPTTDLEILRNYAGQRCAMITGAQVCSQGHLMQAQRATEVFIGNGVTMDGMRRLAAELGADYVVILRVVRWENQISYRPERSLLLLSATSFLNTTLQLLITPIGLLFGMEKQATVGLFATVFTAAGDVRFTTAVTQSDRPVLSLLTADPVEAAKAAINDILYQIAVAL